MARNSVADFQRDVKARSGKTVYAAVPNVDGSLSIQRPIPNQPGAMVNQKVFWVAGGGALTDANLQGDRVVIIDPNGNVGIADATVYLNTLT